MSIRSQRKDDHVALALKQEKVANDFSLVKIIHQGLPEISYHAVDASIEVFGRRFEYPIYINAMTGGSLKTLETNRKLALIAQKFNIPMAVGSQHAALDDESLIATYRIVRDTHPEGFVIGNVSANASVEQAQNAVQMIDANALGIHINVAQEISMDEGDRDFTMWKKNIKAIVEALDVPVIVKEVGFGMSAKTVQELMELGVQYVDVSGHGGTNFAWIENQRSETKHFDYLVDWGISTVESMLMNQVHKNSVNLLASGGVSNPLDVIKLLALGAQAVGISGYFLKVSQLDEDLMMEEVERFLNDIKLLMTLVGCEKIADLVGIEREYLGRLVSYNEAL